MAAKDKAYEKHQEAAEVDRPKEFKVPLVKTTTTEEYVRAWCLANGLRINAPIRQANRGVDRVTAPHCTCGRPCQLYGGRGGYSVKCKECNEKNAARQREKRAARKAS
jgi:hypothetical protein